MKTFDIYFSSEEIFLIEILFRDKEYDFNSIDEKKLLKIAAQNGISQLLYKNDCSKKLSNEARSQLKDEYYYNLGKNSACQLIASEIAQKLSEKNIPVIFLKGISLISEIYKDIALRQMSDIDIMTKPQDVYEAWYAINHNTIEMKRNDDKTGHHLPCFNYRGINVELHRALFPMDVKYQIPVDEVFNNVKNIEDYNALILKPVHQVVYLLLHIYYTFRQGGTRLGWFYDIKALINHYEDQITIEKVENIANKLKIFKPVRKMLVFFTVLYPENKLSVTLSKRDINEAIRLIKTFHSSDSLTVEYGYGLAYERLAQTKGLKNKCLFLYNALLDDGKGNHKFSFKRLIILFIGTLKLLWRKFR